MVKLVDILSIELHIAKSKLGLFNVHQDSRPEGRMMLSIANMYGAPEAQHGMPMLYTARSSQ